MSDNFAKPRPIKRYPKTMDCMRVMVIVMSEHNSKGNISRLEKLYNPDVIIVFNDKDLHHDNRVYSDNNMTIYSKLSARIDNIFTGIVKYKLTNYDDFAMIILKDTIKGSSKDILASDIKHCVLIEKDGISGKGIDFVNYNSNNIMKYADFPIDVFSVS